MGVPVKRRARVRNDGLVCKTTGSCAKRRARVQNDGLVCKTTGTRSKRQVFVSVGGVRKRHAGPNATLLSGGDREGK